MGGRYSPSIAAWLAPLLLAAQGHALTTWTPGPNPSGGWITQPVDNGVYACGADVHCSCVGATDYDRWTTDGPCPESGLGYDDGSPTHPLWWASHGSWKDGDHDGHGVVWIAPNEETAGITFKMWDDDLPKAIEWWESGSRDDVSSDPNGFLQDTVSGVRDCPGRRLGSVWHSRRRREVPDPRREHA